MAKVPYYEIQIVQTTLNGEATNIQVVDLD
jgi:hypothetical protein